MEKEIAHQGRAVGQAALLRSGHPAVQQAEHHADQQARHQLRIVTAKLLGFGIPLYPVSQAEDATLEVFVKGLTVAVARTMAALGLR